MKKICWSHSNNCPCQHQQDICLHQCLQTQSLLTLLLGWTTPLRHGYLQDAQKLINYDYLLDHIGYESGIKQRQVKPKVKSPSTRASTSMLQWERTSKILRKMMLRWGNHSLKRETSPIFWKIRTPSRKGNIKAGWTSARNKSLSSNSQIGKTSSIKLRETIFKEEMGTLWTTGVVNFNPSAWPKILTCRRFHSQGRLNFIQKTIFSKETAYKMKMKQQRKRREID